MTVRGMLNAAQGMQYFQRRVETTSSNLANLESDGFKSDLLTASLRAGTMMPEALATIDLSQGTLNRTGRTMDMALEGPGFFTLGTPAGERLTRRGGMELDGLNRLSDGHGNLYLGEKGPITMPSDHAVLEVAPDGTVLADGQVLDKLRLATVADPATLTKEGEGRFVAGGKVLPLAADLAPVRQGAIEESNMNVMSGTIDLVMIQRAYASNVEALKAMDSVLGSVVNEVGKV